MFYRLRLIDELGIVSYSRIVRVFKSMEGVLIKSVAPGLNSGTATVNIVSSKSEQIQIEITDMLGRKIKTQTGQLSAGNNAIQLKCNTLSAGIYQLCCYTLRGRSNSMRFMLNVK